MAKKFAGFSAQQTEVLARKLGFNGPMDQFQNYLKSNQGLQQQFSKYESAAQKAVENSREKRGFATGGLVGNEAYKVTQTPMEFSDQNGKKVTTSITAVTPNSNSKGQVLSNDMFNNPEKHVSQSQTQNITAKPDEFINQNSGQVAALPDIKTETGKTSDAKAADKIEAPVIDTTKTQGAVENAVKDFEGAKGTVSNNSLVEAVTADPSVKATVAGQLNELMKQFEGGEVPPWASGAVRNANAIMAQRGLGSSSMAGAATFQAAMESALEIAVRDAATYSTFELKNLDNRQQAALVNAQAFLQMDLANLDNEQQALMLKNQSIVQSLFTDAAAENATKQFNASSKQQTDQFFANLQTQVSLQNAAQKNAMEQFNVSAKNATAQFNQQIKEQRNQFNAANRLIVDQSNAEWRRSINTINTAEQNENNRLNAQQMTNMTMAAYNNMMQAERDSYAFLYQSTENALERSAQMVMAQFAAQNESALANMNNKSNKANALGSLAGSIINSVFSRS